MTLDEMIAIGLEDRPYIVPEKNCPFCGRSFCAEETERNGMPHCRVCEGMRSRAEEAGRTVLTFIEGIYKGEHTPAEVERLIDSLAPGYHSFEARRQYRYWKETAKGES